MGIAYDYMMCYRNITLLDLATGMIMPDSPVDVHQYRNHGSDYRSDSDRGTTQGMSELNSLWGEIHRRSGNRGGSICDLSSCGLRLEPYGGPVISRRTLQTAFTGKASWEVSRLVLQLAAWTGRFAALRTLRKTPQTYADAFLGLDCNGFLGNCLRHMGRSPNDPQTDARLDALWAPVTSRRLDIRQIRQYDVICFTNCGHVAIIDSVPMPVAGSQDRVEAMVVEATGSPPDVQDQDGNWVRGSQANDGLQYSMYTFTKHPWGAFEQRRPSTRGGNPPPQNALRAGEFQLDRGLTHRQDRSTAFIAGEA